MKKKKMRKKILFLLLSFLCLTACQKDKDMLTLELEPYEYGTKQFFGDLVSIIGYNGNAIWVNGEREIAMTDDSGRPTVEISKESSSYIAIYPYTWAHDNAITYPEEQTYDTNTFLPPAPMAGSCGKDDRTMKMHNLGSILALNIKGEMNVRRIELIAEDGVLITGTAPLDGLSTGNPTMGALANGTNTVILRCKGTHVPAGGEIFNIALPPVTAQFTIKVYDETHCYTIRETEARSYEISKIYTQDFVLDEATTEQLPPLPNQICYATTDNIEIEPSEDLTDRLGMPTQQEIDGIHFMTFSCTIPNIPENSFANTDNLAFMILPEGLTAIMPKAFYGCNAMTSIKLPSTLTDISSFAFSYCDGMTEITFPDGLTTIGQAAFAVCSALTSVHLPNSLTSMGRGAFGRCYELTYANIPDKITTIEKQMFYCCYALATVDISGNVTEIGEKVFAECNSLTTIRFHGTTAPATISSDAFTNVPSNAVLYLPVDTPQSQIDIWSNVWPGSISTSL